MSSTRRRTALFLGAYALAGGLVTLVGWFANLPRLTDWVNSGIAMFANTSIAASCAGTAIIIAATPLAWAKRAGGILGGVVLAIGGATLLQHVSGINLGIDTLLVREPWGLQATAPGRMGPPASTCYTLIGIGLVLLGTQRGRRFAPALGICVCIISTLALIGYMFGASPLFSSARWTAIAFQTATILFALAIGIVDCVPDAKPMRTFSQDSAAGLLARRSLPLIVALCVVLGWLCVRGQEAGLFDTALGTAALVLMQLILISGLLWWCAEAVAKREEKQKRAEEALGEAHEKLSRHTVKLEEIVRQRTAKLEETIGELEAFSYSIVHDLRSPLRSMQSFAQLLSDECGPLSATSTRYVERITNAARRMDRLIQDVLSYSQIVRSEFPLERIELATLLREILESYPPFQPPNAEVDLDGIFPVVWANEAALTQCISNLLGNAVKFVSPGLTPQVRVWSEEHANQVRLFFKDNGIGIEKGAHDKIFQMFQRLSKAYEGTGIGLAIVQKTIQRMGGTVGLQSEPGEGSTFWIELKIAQRSETPKI
jgi:signal transduction histidine kinase